MTANENSSITTTLLTRHFIGWEDRYFSSYICFYKLTQRDTFWTQLLLFDISKKLMQVYSHYPYEKPLMERVLVKEG